MKEKRGMLGFWITIVIAATFSGAVISLAYFNPSRSLRGLLATLAIASVFLLVCNLIINRLQKYEKENKKNEEKDAYASSEAVSAAYELESEFNRLVSEIAWFNAKASGKLLTHEEADSENCPKEKLISPEDMERAFWEAANLVSRKCGQPCVSCGNDCDRQTLLQKIKNLRKKYEEKAETS